MKVHELIKKLQDLKADDADVLIFNAYECVEEELDTVSEDDDGGNVVLTGKPDND